MLKWLIRRRLAAFARTYDYDVSYMRDMADISTGAVLAFGRIEKLARYRRDVPPAAYYAAGLAAILAEDCGPCTQLAVTIAERAGVAPAILRAVLAGDASALPEDAALGFRFAEAVRARDAAADELREAIVARWGRRALLSLAFAIATAHVFPAVKFALGHGERCLRVTVAGSAVAVRRKAA